MKLLNILIHTGGRVRRGAAIFEQIGVLNAAKIYTNRILGVLLFSRLASLFLIRAEKPFRAIMNIAKTSADPAIDTVTFVIPTWNGMKDNIERLLASIRAQSWPNIDIVAVDSGSTDGTLEVLERFGATIIPIAKEDFRHDTARNLGAQKATGKYIVFTVQDAFFSDPSWVELGIKHLRHYGAKSYCTPQICGPGADYYARFLSYNFIAANRYVLGANIFGSYALGAAAYALVDPVFRQRIIHVDDTNHMVERAFFLKRRYALKTCEDMEFGRKLICAGEKFVFSTLSSITHHHGYTNHIKYFTRVFLDNLVINDLTAVRMTQVKRDGMIDTLFYFSCMLFKYLDDVLNYYEYAGVTNVELSDLYGDEKEMRAVMRLAEDEKRSTVHFMRIVNALNVRVGCIDDAMLITAPKHIDCAVVRDLLQALQLTPDDLSPVLDRTLIKMLRARACGHMGNASRVLSLNLNVYQMPLKEYRIYVTNLLVDVVASTIAWYDSACRDDTSAVLGRLKGMSWA